MNYWIIVDDHHEGPYTGRQLVDNGLKPETLVWADGLTDWTPASDIAELAALLEERPPHTQPAADVTEPVDANTPEVQQEVPNTAPQAAAVVEAAPVEPCPPAYIAWSIIATLLCCVPVGIPAIVFASMTKSAYYRGDLVKSKRYSELAQWFIIAAIVLGAMSWPFQIALSGIM